MLHNRKVIDAFCYVAPYYLLITCYLILLWLISTYNNFIYKEKVHVIDLHIPAQIIRRYNNSHFLILHELMCIENNSIHLLLIELTQHFN